MCVVPKSTSWYTVELAVPAEVSVNANLTLAMVPSPGVNIPKLGAISLTTLFVKELIVA